VHKFLRCAFLFVLPQYEMGLLTHFFISNETHPTKAPFSEVDEFPGDSEGTDSNEEEAGTFDDEEEGGNSNEKGGVSGEDEVAEDMDLGRKGGDVDGVVSTEGQKIVEEFEMPGVWDDLGSVRNSEGSGHVPITQKELSIIDSVSPNN
jgi:hypothetical protein